MCQHLIERLLYLVCMSDIGSGGSGSLATTCQLLTCNLIFIQTPIAPILPHQQRSTPPPRVASPVPLSPSDVPVQYTIKSSVGNAMSIPVSLF